MKSIKHLIWITLFFLSLSSNAQWKYKSGGNAFDGKYKTSYVIGKGNDFPYNDPQLVINVFNWERLNFYLSSAGYFSNEEDVRVLWVFNHEADVIYESVFSISDDNETIFFSSFINLNTAEEVNKTDFIKKLKKANKASIRLYHSSGKRDFVFNLSGSTKAINYVIDSKYKLYLKNKEKEVNDLLREIDSLKTLKKEMVNSRLLKIDSLFRESKISENDLVIIRNKIIEDVDEDNLFKIENIEVEHSYNGSFRIKLLDEDSYTVTEINRVKLPELHKSIQEEKEEEEERKRIEEKNKKIEAEKERKRIAKVEEEKRKNENALLEINEKLKAKTINQEERERILSEIENISKNAKFNIFEIKNIRLIKIKKPKSVVLKMYNDYNKVIGSINMTYKAFDKKYLKRFKAGESF